MDNSGLTETYKVTKERFLSGNTVSDWINAGTINPARVLKIDHKKGRIRANYDADLVILDRDYEVVETYVLGQSVYTR